MGGQTSDAYAASSTVIPSSSQSTQLSPSSYSSITMDPHRSGANLPIILGSILGVSAIAVIVFAVLFYQRRSRQLGRKGLLSFRSATPLDDVEFESWRKPSESRQWPEKSGDQSPSSSVKPQFRIVERRLSSEDAVISPTQPVHHRPVRVLDHVRSKSSISVRDRPPTPYSSNISPRSPTFPNSPFVDDDPPSQWGRIYHPSTSTTSDFDIDMKHSPRQYLDSERWSKARLGW